VPHGPPDGPGIEAPRHDELQLRSVIRLRLWDVARWKGIGYAAFEAQDPVLTLLFDDGSAARKIVDGWLSDIGADDADDRIHLSVVRGIRKDHPYWYRFVVGSGYPEPSPGSRGFEMSLSRIHEMTPNSDTNLRLFLSSFATRRAFLLAVAEIPRTATTFGEVRTLGTIKKHTITVRDAWEVAEGDLESIAIHADDDPVIPAVLRDPPVRRLLERLRRQQADQT
jgi:hypothetical protein